MADKDKEKTDDLETLAGEIKTLAENVAKKTDEAKKAAEEALAETKSLGKITEETKEKFDKAFSEKNELAEKLTALTSRFDALEQKSLRRGKDEDEPAPQKSVGQYFMDSEEAKKLNSSFRGQVTVKMNTKDILNVTATVGTGASPASSIVPGFRIPGIVQLIGDRRLTVRDLIAPGQTNTNSVEYARENVFTNNARVVSEGAAKPKSDITFELQTAPVRTLAHYFKASRQILDDAPGLRSYIDARARYGLRLAEENELLNGDGTGQHIHGLIPQATAYSASFTPATPTVIDTIRLAMLQVVLSEFPPNGTVLNPIDWVRVQLTKDTQGRYIIGNPADSNTPRLWNLPIVETQAMTQDKFLVGAFDLAAQIFDRMDLEILLSTENEDDFIKNMVTIRCEERLALAVYRPASLIYGDFGNVT